MPNTTALVLILSDLHEVLRPYLEQNSPAAAAGLKAHLTLLYPFLPMKVINEKKVDRLRHFFQHRGPLQFSLVGTSRFPGQLYLTLAHGAKIRKLVQELRAEFDGLPADGGNFSDATPHVTIARAAGNAGLNRLEDLFWKQYGHHFPFVVKVNVAALIYEQKGRLQPIQTFPFGV